MQLGWLTVDAARTSEYQVRLGPIQEAQGGLVNRLASRGKPGVCAPRTRAAHISKRAVVEETETCTSPAAGGRGARSALQFLPPAARACRSAGFGQQAGLPGPPWTWAGVPARRKAIPLLAVRGPRQAAHPACKAGTDTSPPPPTGAPRQRRAHSSSAYNFRQQEGARTAHGWGRRWAARACSHRADKALVAGPSAGGGAGRASPRPPCSRAPLLLLAPRRRLLLERLHRVWRAVALRAALAPPERLVQLLQLPLLLLRVGVVCGTVTRNAVEGSGGRMGQTERPAQRQGSGGAGVGKRP
jgi:hypothetical protein